MLCGKESNTKLEIKALGKKCNRCGFEDIRALCIDHKEGGGHLERSKLKGQYYVAICKKIISGSS